MPRGGTAAMKSGLAGNHRALMGIHRGDTTEHSLQYIDINMCIYRYTMIYHRYLGCIMVYLCIWYIYV